MGILIFIIILAILVLTHELGHFIAAKKAGVRVDEFGLGFPPRIWGFKKGETIYSINWIPFGGFVKIFGETPDEESLAGPESGRSLVNKKKRVQAIVLVAGVTFNVLLAWFLLSVGLAVGLPLSESSAPAQLTLTNPHIIITNIVRNSPAAKSGLRLGDTILTVTDQKGAKVDNPTTVDLQNFFAGRAGQSLSVELSRNYGPEKGQTKTLVVVPEKGVVGDRAAIGISMDKVAVLKLPVWQAIYRGLIFTGNIFYSTIVALVHLLVGAFAGKQSLDAVTGPVGLAGLVGNLLALGVPYLLSFMALISINLAVINLFPFPALDGGRLFFLFIEWLKGSRINPKIANTINLIGFALLLLLMVVVTYHDIMRAIGG